MIQLPWQSREIQLHQKRRAEKVPLCEARLIRPLPWWFHREGASVLSFSTIVGILDDFYWSRKQTSPIYSIKLVIILSIKSHVHENFREFIVVLNKRSLILSSTISTWLYLSTINHKENCVFTKNNIIRTFDIIYL